MLVCRILLSASIQISRVDPVGWLYASELRTAPMIHIATVHSKFLADQPLFTSFTVQLASSVRFTYVVVQ